MLNRRTFLTTTAGAVLAGSASAGPAGKPKIKKAVKYAMVGPGKTVREKFDLLKKLGFDGVEIDSPSGLNLAEANEAQKATGVKIHGVVDSVHWRDTLSHPDEAVRARGLKALLGAIQDAQTVGADTVLLVPGVVNKDVTYEQCYERSQAEVKKALPAAEKAKVKIAIEVVWNNFITRPEQLVQYVDDFKSEWVGAYMDWSNMLKYGAPASEWVRKVGKRIVKLDIKAYSKAKGFDIKIGEGDEDWPEVRKALAEIGYEGWATAEVRGGDEAYLRDVAERMDRVLGLKA